MARCQAEGSTQKGPNGFETKTRCGLPPSECPLKSSGLGMPVVEVTYTEVANRFAQSGKAGLPTTESDVKISADVLVPTVNTVAISGVRRGCDGAGEDQAALLN